MNYDKYEFVRVSEDREEYRFQSVGPKGMVEMIIQFQRINLVTYNLAFGKIKKDGRIDDAYNVNNLDTGKILSTVSAAVFDFTSAFPDNLIYFCGNTPARCRLYRIAIGNNLDELSEQFEILGVRESNSACKVESFLRNISYVEYFIRRRLN